jgi:hypothetical protein
MNVYRFLGVASCLLVAACTPTPPANGGNPTTPAPSGHEPITARELMITDLSVVNDSRATGPDGVWSFGGLIKAMAGTIEPGQFMVDWLKTWEASQTVNGFSVPARPTIRARVIDPWKAKDGQAGVSDAAWRVNLANAPFRLLAVVNRLDLNRGNGTTVVDNAGEGRFVFGVTDGTGAPLPFTVIFEYELLAKDRETLRGWAQTWHALGTKAFGADYNAALQQITDRFSGKNKAPSKPNGSPLNQIRTNEIALNSTWELREFHIAGGKLQEVPTLQSPDNSLQNTARLAKFINDNEADILDRKFTIPAQFESAPFLAGSSLVPFGFFWRAPGVGNNEARHIISLNACNGCHHRETNTNNFLHVANRPANAAAALSGFLTGVTVIDPVNSGTSRTFNDLAARAEVLKLIATESGDVKLQSITRDRASRVH